MYTSQQVAVIPQGSGPSVPSQRQRRSIAEQRIVEETLVEGASVARVELRQAKVRIEGSADAVLLPVLLECLRG